MATRLYFMNGGSPIIVGGTFNAFWGASNTTTSQLNRTRGTSAFTTVTRAESVSTNPLDVGLVQFESGALAYQTISGTLKCYIRASEDIAAADFKSQLYMYVIDANGSVRGTLYAGNTDATLTSEWALSTLTNRTFPRAALVPITLSSVTAHEGDRIIVEVGYRALNTVTTTYTGSIEIGENNATELAENETATTQNTPWIEFNTPLTFSTDFRNTFESGSNNTDITKTNSDDGSYGLTGTGFTGVGASGRTTYQTSAAYHNSMGYQAATSTSQSAVLSWHPGRDLTLVSFYTRAYINFGSAPSVNTYLINMGDDVLIGLNTSRKIIVATTTPTVKATSSTTLSTSTWYRIEGKTATDGTGNVRIYDVPDSTGAALEDLSFTGTSATTTMKSFFGVRTFSNTSYTVKFDDVGWSTVTWLGPSLVTITNSGFSVNWASLQQITKTQAINWVSKQQVTKTQAINWVSSASISKTQAVAWNCAARITKSQSVAWSSGARVTATFSISWDQIERVSKTRAVAWAVLVQVDADPVNVAWAVGARVIKTQSILWAIEALSVENTFPVSWSIREIISPAATHAVEWNAAETIDADFEINWTLSGAGTVRVTQFRTVNWAGGGRVTLEQDIGWVVRDVATGTDPSPTDTFGVRGSVPAGLYVFYGEDRPVARNTTPASVAGGGVTVTVTGENLGLVNGVKLGGVAVPFVWVNEGGTELYFISENRAVGDQELRLALSSLISLSIGTLTYTEDGEPMPDLTVTDVDPDHRNAAGDQWITLIGTGLEAVSSVILYKMNAPETTAAAKQLLRETPTAATTLQILTPPRTTGNYGLVLYDRRGRQTTVPSALTYA